MHARRLRAAGIGLLGSILAPAALGDVNVDISGVDETVRRNVELFLSLERHKKRDDIDDVMFEQLLERAEQEVRNALRPFGYYEPQVTVTPLAGGSAQDRRVAIRIDPGRPVILQQVALQI
ncbi:MAG: POTRA domain-containing protein, partial [Gammaproteobacteria bacterium]|nr:POTRA domain-containing protein [Gammaproteobacteria bacterium]